MSEVLPSAPIRLSFVQEGLAPGDFLPLAPKGRLDVAVEDLVRLVPAWIDVTGRMLLREGHRDLPLIEGERFPVDVPPRCECRFQFAAGRSSSGVKAEGAPRSIVNLVALSFDPPLVLHNIVPILARLPEIFEDRQLKEILDRIETSRLRKAASSSLRRIGRSIGRRVMPRIEEAMGGRETLQGARERLTRHLREGAEAASVVLLRHVTGRPVLRNGEWQLELRFTGHVRSFGAGEIPFTELHVPQIILPLPHAVLERIVSGEAIATAHLRKDRLRTRDLAEVLGDAVASFEGNLAFRGPIPGARVDLGLIDGGTWALHFGLESDFEVQSSFVGNATESTLEIELRNAEIRQAGGARDRALVLPRASLSLFASEARPGGLSWWRLSAHASDLHENSVERVSGDEIRLTVEVAEGSVLDGLRASGCSGHPLLRGETHVELRPGPFDLAGRIHLAVGAAAHNRAEDSQLDMDLRFSADRGDLAHADFSDGDMNLALAFGEGRLSGRLHTPRPGHVEFNLRTRGTTRLEARGVVGAFPELSIHEGHFTAQAMAELELDGHAAFDIRGTDSLEADFSGTRLSATFLAASANLDAISLKLPAPFTFRAAMRDAVLATTGLGRAELDVDYDLGGRSPILEGPGERVEVFVPELRTGDFTLAIGSTGRLAISGPERGLYDARYFNALIRPDRELRRWLEILENDQAIDRVIASVSVFSKDGARYLDRLRRIARRFRGAIELEGLEEIGDALPGRKIARLLSRLLTDWKGHSEPSDPAGSTRLEERLFQIVKRVTDGRGLDVVETRRLLEETLPDNDLDFEIDRLLRWLAILLAPTEPIRPHPVLSLEPIAEEPRFLRRFEGLPRAADLYAFVDASEPPPEGFSALLARVAPFLTEEQLAYLCARRRDAWRPRDLARARYIAELKRRTRMIGEGYGGLGYAPQALAIAFFLPEPVAITHKGPDAVEVERFGEDCPVPFTVLGPQDVATLLQAGLSSALPNRTVQLNQRMLLDLLLELPQGFLVGVLLEMGGRSAWVLAGVLNALLEMPQDAVREPLDLVSSLGEKTGVEFPRRVDYMAGGRFAKMSYFEALARTAEQILAMAEPYEALKSRLQVRRASGTGIAVSRPDVSEIERKAQACIAKADAAGGRCTFQGREARHQATSRKLYLSAFKACEALLRADPTTFQRDWFKSFWARNHEALVVLSVVRNVQEDVDDVRHWLRVRSGSELPREEQALLELVIDALYLQDEDKAALKRDPLVRLLIDPEEGRYDFTIVSCMGVVTEGAAGTELEETYQRLWKKRGIGTIRADTATARSLEFNARRVEAAIRRVQGPFGLVGYSQGCANALQTEAALMGGTPEQRELLRGLRCRNLLFSAINGSAHGSCWDLKFQRAMVDAERFLSLYQAFFSTRAIETALLAVRLGMDSPTFVQSMWGVHSLSHEGVLKLGREGQFVETAPSSLIRGVVRPEVLPEALEFLSNVLTHQIESDQHDTQVALGESVGYPVFVRNAQASILARCDMGCLPQVTHHWSPLVRETAFIRTERDRERAIYAFPKDRHIFPWIEVNARFGVIARRTSAGAGLKRDENLPLVREAIVASSD